MDEESVQFYQCIFRELKKKLLDEKLNLQNADRLLSKNPEMMSQTNFLDSPNQMITKPIIENNSSQNESLDRVDRSKCVESCHKGVSAGVPPIKSKSDVNLKLENRTKEIPKHEKKIVSRSKHDCEGRHESYSSVAKEKPDLQIDKSCNERRSDGDCTSISYAVSKQKCGQVMLTSKIEKESSASNVCEQDRVEGLVSSKRKFQRREEKVRACTDIEEGECKKEIKVNPISRSADALNEDKASSTSKCKSPRKKSQIGVSLFKSKVDCNSEIVKTDLKTRFKNICKKGRQGLMSTKSQEKCKIDKLENISKEINADTCKEDKSENAALSTDKSRGTKENKISAISSSCENKKHVNVNRVPSKTKVNASVKDKTNGEGIPAHKRVSEKENKLTASASGEVRSNHLKMDGISNNLNKVDACKNKELISAELSKTSRASRKVKKISSIEDRSTHFKVDGISNESNVGGRGSLPSESECNNGNIATLSIIECKRKNTKSDVATYSTAPDLCKAQTDTLKDQIVCRKKSKIDATLNNEEMLEKDKVERIAQPITLTTHIDSKVQDSCISITKSVDEKDIKRAVKSKSESISTKCKLEDVCSSKSASLCTDAKLGGKGTEKRQRSKRVNTSKNAGTFKSDKLEVIPNSTSTYAEGKHEGGFSQLTKNFKKVKRKDASMSISTETVKSRELLVISNSSSTTTCKGVKLDNINSQITYKGNRQSKKELSRSKSEYTVCRRSDSENRSQSSSTTVCINEILGSAYSQSDTQINGEHRKAVVKSKSECTIFASKALLGVNSHSSSTTASNNEILVPAISQISTKINGKHRKTASASTSEHTIGTSDDCLNISSNSSSATTSNQEISGPAVSQISKKINGKHRKNASASTSEHTIGTNDDCLKVPSSSSSKNLRTSLSEHTIGTNDECLKAPSNSSTTSTCSNKMLESASSQITQKRNGKCRKAISLSTNEYTSGTSAELEGPSNANSSATCNDGKLDLGSSNVSKLINRQNSMNSTSITSENSIASAVVRSNSSLSSDTILNQRKMERLYTLFSSDISKKPTLRNISLPKSIGVRYQEQLRKASVSKSDGNCTHKKAVNICMSKSTGTCGGNGSNNNNLVSDTNSSWSISEREYELRKGRKKYVSASSSSRTCFGDNTSTVAPASSRSGSSKMATTSCVESSEDVTEGGRSGLGDKFRNLLATVNELEESVTQSQREENLLVTHTAHVEELNDLLNQQVVQTGSSAFREKNKKLKRRLRYRKIQLQNLRSLLRLREDYLCESSDDVAKLKNQLLKREKSISRLCKMFLNLKVTADEQVIRVEQLQAELNDVTKMFALLQSTPSEVASGEIDSVENLLLEQVKKNSRLSLENSRLRKVLVSLSSVTTEATFDEALVHLDN